MRKFLLFPLLALIAMPAAARDRAGAPPPREPNARDAARILSSPTVQAGVVGLVGAVSDALLDTRVGPIADIAPDSGVRPDDRLGDVVRRDDPGFDRRLRSNMQGAMATTGRAAGDIATMTDELRATIERVKRTIGAR
ncbi:hypothetical protein [uncultured Sphingomonas sp.]|uniref:hypothetical protein n=1 Tax=uncultured Sphingomonas sp. TaxID=158754 RepID=UPI0035CAD10A